MSYNSEYRNRNTRWKQTFMKSISFLLLLFPGVLAFPQTTIYKNWGYENDFSMASPAYLENYDLTVSTFIYTENPTTGDFYPFLLNTISLPNAGELLAPGELPPQDPEFIRYRALKNVYVTNMKIISNDFELDATGHPQKTLYLKLRYKDTTLGCQIDSEYGPDFYNYKNKGVTIQCWDGSGWQKIGETEGAFDFAWKNVVCEIPPEQILAEKSHFTFRLGGGWFGGSSIYGNWLAIEAVALSDCVLISDPVQPGFWPEVETPDQLQNLAEAGLSLNGKPFFPLGLHITPEIEDQDLIQKAHEAGLNLVVFNGWNAHKQPGEGTNATWNSFSNTLNGIFYRGLPEFLDSADSLKMKVLVWFSSDATANRIHGIGHRESHEPFLLWTPYDGTFPGWLRTVQIIVERYKNHPALWGWFIKDEADHDQESDENDVGASNFSPEMVRALYKAVRETDSEHPCYLNLMNWKRFATLAYKETADIFGVDKYPELSESLLLARLFYHSAKEIQPKAFVPHIGTFEDAPAGFQRMRLHSFLALIFQARGLLYFRTNHRTRSEWWESAKTFFSQLDLIAVPFFHPQISRELGHVFQDDQRDGWYKLPQEAVGEGITRAPGVLSVFRENRKTGERLLLAVNLLEQAQPVQFSQISGLAAGSSVEVLFENRRIGAGLENFTDEFASFDAHIYRLPPAGVPVRQLRSEATPVDFGIFPNPAKDSVTFIFELKHSEQIALSIYNLLGQEMVLLHNGNLQSGKHYFSQNLVNLPSGIYFGKFQRNRELQMSKFVVVH